MSPKKLLATASLVFWDFDGVIKDSLSVKANAFEELFLPFGREVAKRIREHHEAHGGMSRFEKIPLYLSWAGEITSKQRVEEFCIRFSRLVLQAVIDSPWVSGVPEYLLEQKDKQYSVLVTATPQHEMEKILECIGIAGYFREVYGAPNKKVAVIKNVLSRLKYSSDQVLMVGDADTDLFAAEDNGILFLLRRTSLNQQLQATYTGPMFDDLVHE